MHPELKESEHWLKVTEFDHQEFGLTKVLIKLHIDDDSS